MPEYISYLPHLNAILNSTSAILLAAGYRFIRKGRIDAHRNCQLTAFSTSTLFLISYTILAVVIVPMILLTLYRAARRDFVRHRRIARWTLPLWLYVSVTGVVVYLMLYHLYPQ